MGDLNLKRKKCHFLEHEIHYLAHLISGKTLYSIPEKLKSIEDILRDFPNHCQPPEEFEARARQAHDWGVVCGELLTFDDPEARLSPIDRLEGFRADGHSLYRRVLVPTTGESAGEVVWVDTIEATHLKGRRIVSGRWPEVAG